MLTPHADGRRLAPEHPPSLDPGDAAPAAPSLGDLARADIAITSGVPGDLAEPPPVPRAPMPSGGYHVIAE